MNKNRCGIALEGLITQVYYMFYIYCVIYIYIYIYIWLYKKNPRPKWSHERKASAKLRPSFGPCGKADKSANLNSDRILLATEFMGVLIGQQTTKIIKPWENGSGLVSAFLRKVVFVLFDVFLIYLRNFVFSRIWSQSIGFP